MWVYITVSVKMCPVDPLKNYLKKTRIPENQKDIHLEL